MNEQLKILGNVIGDILMQLEIEATGAGKDQFQINRIRWLIDIYAEQFDEVLSKHNRTMFKELKKLIQCLVIDLGKITGQEKQVTEIVIKKKAII